MTVVTRFAPSPTGYLHIGGARTALFNWLFARHNGGKFLLRIEDTDRQRSTDDAIRAILDGMKWLGLNWDGQEIYQFTRAARHAEVAKQMLEMGKAYHCYAQPHELEELRAKALAEGKLFRSPWRDRDASDAPAGVNPVIRLKAPAEGETVINDLVQGRVVVKNDQLDDMILLRSDGTPTYMHAVVVDDHDMAVTHVIRGDDHLTNAFRQYQIYAAMGWNIPEFAHIPLIHGADGAKLSKRHGAVGLEAYRDMGFLPDALKNYLLRLGWSHGDEEIISIAKAVEWFNLDAVGKSASRFDTQKLESVNAHYIRETDNAVLAGLTRKFIEEKLGFELSDADITLLTKAMSGLKVRAKTLLEIADGALFYFTRDAIAADEKAAVHITTESIKLLKELIAEFEKLSDWNAAEIEKSTKQFLESKVLKLGAVGQPLRAVLTGTLSSPALFETLELLGLSKIRQRIASVQIGG